MCSFCLRTTGVVEEDDDEDEMRKAFNLYDTDGSGTITKEELKKAMASLGETLSDEAV